MDILQRFPVLDIISWPVMSVAMNAKNNLVTKMDRYK